MGKSEGKEPFSRLPDLAGVQKELEARLPLQLKACRELMDRVDADLHGWPGRLVVADPRPEVFSPEEIVAREFGRSLRIAKAEIYLSEGGYGEQASMLNRSLLESLFVTHWVRDKPEEAVDRYLESIAFDHHLEATSGIKHDPGKANDFNYYLLGDNDLKKMASKYGPYNERAWTGLGGIHGHFEAIKHRIPESIQRATEIYLEVGHRDNNRMLHSSARGLSRVGRVVDRAGEEGVWLQSGPSTSHVEDALFQTWWIFSQMYLETAK